MSDAPDLTQKVLGYRQFGVVDGGLCSIGVGTFHWLPGPNHARCLARHLHRSRPSSHSYLYSGPPPSPPPERHPAPAPGCNCGLYGWHEFQQEWLDGGLGAQYEGLALIAAIRAWGKMEIHRTGFRAEYAEVALLGFDPFVGLRKMRDAQDVAQAYGVRAVDLEAFEAMAVELGEPVPMELRPEEPKPAPPPPTFNQSWVASGNMQVSISDNTLTGTEGNTVPPTPTVRKRSSATKRWTTRFLSLGVIYSGEIFIFGNAAVFLILVAVVLVSALATWCFGPRDEVPA